ncbi:MAG: hypothetical protein ABH950_08245 [Candidatus Altiarchaeota archaeon]
MAKRFRQYLTGFLLLILILLLVFSILPIVGMHSQAPAPLNCYDSDGYDFFSRGFVQILNKDLRVYDECDSSGLFLFEGVCIENQANTVLVDCSLYENMTCGSGECRP